MSDKQVVNPWFLTTLLDPLLGLADVDEVVEEYRSFDPNDEAAARTLIASSIVPYLRQFTDDSVARLKLTVRYYLSSPGFERWGTLFDSVMPPFDHPREPRDFFLWIWDEWFPGEDYRLGDLSQFEIVSDLNQCNRELRRKG
jgi:hypothetical protein